MKVLITLFSILLTLPAISAQEMTSDAWKQDIAFLQQTIDEDYPFLYRKINRESFVALGEELFTDLDSKEDYEIAAGLLRWVSSFEYGHTAVGLQNTPFEFNRLPVHLKEFTDGIYIEGARNEHAEDVGARVVAIAGVPVEEVYKKIYPYFPAENSQFFKAYGMDYLITAELMALEGLTDDLQADVTLTLMKDGKEYKRAFTPMTAGERPPLQYGYTKANGEWKSAFKADQWPLYLKHLDKIYYKEYLEEQNAVYVRHSQIQDDSLQPVPEFYDEVLALVRQKEAEKLIIDVRLNGGGNNYKNIAVIKTILAHPEIDRVGKLFVIIGGRTFSACQNLVNEMDTYTNAIFVGEPTGENINFYGDNNRVVLPNSGIPVYLSFAWWQDKPQWEGGPWLPPHIAVQPSFEDYALGRDPVLQAVFDFNDSEFILDPMGYLTSLFMQGEVEKLQSEAVRISRDERYRFFDFEGRFNDAGFRILSQGQNQEALFVFQLVTGLYPESGMAWLGMGKSLAALGEVDKAREILSKLAEQEDGDEEVAAEALEILQKLEAQ